MPTFHTTFAPNCLARETNLRASNSAVFRSARTGVGHAAEGPSEESPTNAAEAYIGTRIRHQRGLGSLPWRASLNKQFGTSFRSSQSRG